MLVICTAADVLEASVHNVFVGKRLTDEQSFSFTHVFLIDWKLSAMLIFSDTCIVHINLFFFFLVLLPMFNYDVRKLMFVFELLYCMI